LANWKCIGGKEPLLLREEAFLRKC